MSQEKLIVEKITRGPSRGSFVIGEKRESIEMDNLEPGVYALNSMSTGLMSSCPSYTPIEVSERYLPFSKDTAGSRILEKAERFFRPETRTKYSELGIGYKTAFLMYGPTGTGKTVTARLIMDSMCKKYGAICLITAPFNGSSQHNLAVSGVKAIKHMNKPIVLFVDECDKTLRIESTSWLTFLDGVDSIDNLMVLFCTNRLDSIDSRLLRPSRVEHLIEVSTLEIQVALQYLNDKLPKLDKELKAAMAYIATETDGVTMDSFKHAVKDFYINSNGSKQAFEEILKSYHRTQGKKETEEDE